jgi:ribosomal protein S18 acetylase RimI-like enzyme
MNKIRIELVTKDTIKTVIPLRKQLAKENQFLPLPRSEKNKLEWFSGKHRGLGKFLYPGKDIMFLLRDNDKTVGLIYGTWYLQNRGVCLTLGILEQYQDQGYGKKFMAAYLEACKRNHIKRIRLYVSTSNHIAIWMYAKLNFEIIQRGYLPDSKDVEAYGELFLMELFLK